MSRLLLTVFSLCISYAVYSVEIHADIIFINGNIYTVNRAQPRAEAVAVKGDSIVYVGSNSASRKFQGEQTRVVNLEDRLMLPGFHDSHLHAEDAVVFVDECNLYGLYEKQEYLERLRECAGGNTRSWLTGAGWAPTEDESNRLYREDLDLISPDKPVYLKALDGHHAIVNSRALAIAGIDKNTRDPVAGIIHRHESGDPSGLLIESAMWLPWDHVPKRTATEWAMIFQRTMQEANRYGITSMVEAWETPEFDAAWKQLLEQDLLTARVNLAFVIDENWNESFDALTARQFESEMLRGKQVKLLVDGVTENQTAALKEPYHGTGGNRGFMYFSQDQLNRWIPLLERRGFQIHAHTLGDRAMASVLDALELSREQNGVANNRPLFIHCYLIDETDYPRLQATTGTINFTLLWRQADNFMFDINKSLLGEERYMRVMPAAQSFERGLIVTGGSDFYVNQIDPLASITAGITGKAVPYYRHLPYEPDSQPLMPGKKPTLEQMIRAYTINAAYASWMEGYTGSIEKGKRADLIVMERNLFELSPEEIYGTRVLMTMVNGRIVYGSTDF